MVAGRRVGNAVARNRAKRRIRAALARLQLGRDGTYVVVANERVLEAPFGQLIGWLEQALGLGDEEDE